MQFSVAMPAGTPAGSLLAARGSDPYITIPDQHPLLIVLPALPYISPAPGALVGRALPASVVETALGAALNGGGHRASQ
eukprot:5719952-Pleurochrysis_carterae.AAC.2